MFPDCVEEAMAAYLAKPEEALQLVRMFIDRGRIYVLHEKGTMTLTQALKTDEVRRNIVFSAQCGFVLKRAVSPDPIGHFWNCPAFREYWGILCRNNPLHTFACPSNDPRAITLHAIRRFEAEQ